MNFLEYQADIIKRFSQEGRPRPSARERYYSFPSIIRDYPEQFPHDNTPPKQNKPTKLIKPTEGPKGISL